MPIWKRNIFVNAISVRIAQEERTAGEIIQDYPALTAEEKEEILRAIG